MGTRNIEKIVLDTNIITRFLVGDVETQLLEAKEIFRKAEKGDVLLVILPVIVAEVVYILKSFYHLSEVKISDTMQSFLARPWFEIEHEKSILGLWKWYEEGQHFVDSYLLALEKYEGIKIYSFDKNLNRKRNDRIDSI